VDLNEATFGPALVAWAQDCPGDMEALRALRSTAIVDLDGMGVTTNQAIEVAPPEARIGPVGLGSDQMTLDTSPFVTKKISLLSSLGGMREDLRIACELIGAGK
jgi:D-arabinose 1-dehydrogenase-like Zn-dependent alcohol dehydrogenase